MAIAFNNAMRYDNKDDALRYRLMMFNRCYEIR